MRKRKFKKHLALITTTLILASFTTNTLSVGPGFYVGLMFGTGANNAKPQNVQIKRDSIQMPNRNPPPKFRDIPVGPVVLVTAKPRNNNQWGSRLFLGYKMNPYAGFETGFTFFTTINYNLITPDPTLDPCSQPNIRVGAWDVLGRLSMPFCDLFELYVKGGPAVTYVRTAGAFFRDDEKVCAKSENTARVRPVVSLGANMSLSQNWLVDVSYSRYFVGNIASYIDFVAVGVAYHFVDKFCGQFLCDD
jgi:opacity protein-like surface antigen